ncbi:hypothetical protein Alg130_11257 [Pyrenophora tritici-repentis]|nr:hypothetical protein Alg130_11257 [Pyrenophora tritici-repentis]
MNWIPVKFNCVCYSLEACTYYFWDPDYPQCIQFLDQGTWKSWHVSYVKATTNDKNIREIAEKAERILSENQTATEKPGPYQPPTLPSLQSYYAKMPSEAPCLKTVRRTQRPLLPAPSSAASSAFVRKHPYFEAPQEQGPLRQSTTGIPFPGLSVYNMSNSTIKW